MIIDACRCRTITPQTTQTVHCVSGFTGLEFQRCGFSSTIVSESNVLTNTQELCYGNQTRVYFDSKKNKAVIRAVWFYIYMKYVARMLSFKADAHKHTFHKRKKIKNNVSARPPIMELMSEAGVQGDLWLEVLQKTEYGGVRWGLDWKGDHPGRLAETQT